MNRTSDLLKFIPKKNRHATEAHNQNNDSVDQSILISLLIV